MIISDAGYVLIRFILIHYNIAQTYKKKTHTVLPMFNAQELLPAVRTVCVMTTGIRTCPPIVPVLLIFYTVRNRKQKLMWILYIYIWREREKINC